MAMTSILFVSQHIQMHLSKKQKTLSQFLPPFLKSTSSFEHFEKKDELHRLSFFEITDCKRPS